MRMTPECVPCLIRRVLFEAEEVDSDASVKAVKNATKMLGELFTDDPYARLKKRSNDVALEMYPSAERFVKRSKDPLRDAFLCAVVGNVLDFGIGTGFDDPEKLRNHFKGLLGEGLGHDDTPKIKRLLKKAENVVYLGDNCGEIVLDRLALKELKKFDTHITLVVKEDPILTDATLTDIEGLEMEKIVDEIVEAPGFAVGIDLGSIRGKFGKLLEGADLVVAKGMANFESLSETDLAPIAYLLRTKCSPVANAMRLNKDINAVKLFERGLKR
jgi:uncharacterized protein with ATP-grasp and redox domains